MSKFTEKLQNQIVSLIEADTYSITEICSQLKISRKSFYEWQDTKPEFREAIQKAKEQREDKLLMTARRSLKRKLEGYTLTEIRTIYIPDKDNPDKLVLKSKIVREREFAPDTQAIKLVLMRNDARHTEEDEKKETPWNIVVRSQESADQLTQLRENLKNNSREKEMTREEKEEEDKEQEDKEQETKSTEPLSTEPEPLPEKEKSPEDYVLVRRYDLPPGYLYQQVKRKDMRPGEVVYKEL